MTDKIMTAIAAILTNRYGVKVEVKDGACITSPVL